MPCGVPASAPIGSQAISLVSVTSISPGTARSASTKAMSSVSSVVDRSRLAAPEGTQA